MSVAKVDGYEFPGDRWYDPREHLWVLPEAEGTGRLGLDALGQEMLGAVVYVQLAEPGRAVRRGEALGSLEAEKMVRPLLAPVSGTVLEVNQAVLASPRLLNADPYGAGWLCRLAISRWSEEGDDLLHDPAAVEGWARAEIEASR